MGGKLGGLPESEVGGQWFRVPLEEFVRTACLISEVTSVLSQREQSISSRAGPSCTGT